MSNKYFFLTCLTLFSLNFYAGKLIIERSGDVVAFGNSNPNVRFVGSISNKIGVITDFKIDRKKRKIIELSDCGICYFNIEVGNTTSTYKLDFNNASSFHVFTYPSNKTKKYLNKHQDIKLDDPITKTKSGIAKLKIISIKKISKNTIFNGDIDAKQSLIQLKELYEKGLISDEVYSKKVKEILNEI